MTDSVVQDLAGQDSAIQDSTTVDGYKIEKATEQFVQEVMTALSGVTQRVFGQANNNDRTFIQTLFDEYGENFYIAGGFFKDIVNNRTPKDVDLYFRDQESFDKVHKFVEKSGAQLVYANKNAICYKTAAKLTIDLIHRQFRSVEDTLNTFDFTATKAALYKQNGEYYITKDKNFDKHTKNFVLEYSDSTEKTTSSIERVTRYMKYGYQPTRKCLITLIESIKNHELKNYSSSEIFDKICETVKNSKNLEKDLMSIPLERKRVTKDETALTDEEIVAETIKTLGQIENFPTQYLDSEIALSTTLSRVMLQFMYGYQEIYTQCDEKLKQMLPNMVFYDEANRKKQTGTTDTISTTETANTPITSTAIANKIMAIEKLTPDENAYMQKNAISRIHPTITILRFLEKLEKSYTNDQIRTLLSFMTVPTRFVALYPGLKVYTECCESLTPSLIFRHEARTSENLSGCKLVNIERIRDTYNRDNEAEIILLMIEHYGYDDTVYALDIMFAATAIEALPTYKQWIHHINEEIYSPHVPIELFLEITKEDTTEHEPKFKPPHLQTSRPQIVITAATAIAQSREAQRIAKLTKNKTITHSV